MCNEEWKYMNVVLILKVLYCESFDPEMNGSKRASARDVEPFTFAESRDSLLVFVNGAFSRELSNLTALSNDCVAGNLAEIPSEHANVARDHLAAYAD